MSAETPTAAILIIGNEILSGRTRDANLSTIAQWLGELGVDVREARTIPDDEAEIVAAVNALRARYTYLFTTGGIGPTHDDITADCVATAFEVGIDYHPEAMAILEAHYEDQDFTDARKRMARIPDGAALIDNPVSKAPGFRLGNVYVMAGVPVIMQAMLRSIKHEIAGGPPMRNVTVSALVAEGDLGGGLAAIAARHPDVDIGCYPYYGGGRLGASIVLRSRADGLEEAAEAVRVLIRSMGAEPLDYDLSQAQSG